MSNKTKSERATGESVLAFRENMRDAGLVKIETARDGGVSIPADAYSRPLAPYPMGIIAESFLAVKKANVGEWAWTEKRTTAGYDARVPVFLSGAKATHAGQMARGYYLGRGLLTRFGVENACYYTLGASSMPAELRGYTREGDVGATAKPMRFHHTGSGSDGVKKAFPGVAAENIHCAKWARGNVELAVFLAATYAYGFTFSDERQARAKVEFAIWDTPGIPHAVKFGWWRDGIAPSKVVLEFAAFSPSDDSEAAFVRYLKS